MEEKTLLEVTPRIPGTHNVCGFFYMIYDIYQDHSEILPPPPWIDPAESDADLAYALDRVYYYNVSGGKLISPLTREYIDPDTGLLTPLDQDIARTILRLYNAYCFSSAGSA